MTGKPDPVVEIIESVLLGPVPMEGAETPQGWARNLTKEILAALEAAGLKVLPIEATDEMREAAGHVSGRYVWLRMVAAFDPTIYTPEQSSTHVDASATWPQRISEQSDD